MPSLVLLHYNIVRIVDDYVHILVETLRNKRSSQTQPNVIASNPTICAFSKHSPQR
jgi:hypothetical protein